MKLVPLGDKIVLKQLEAEETTKSGIVLPGQAKEKPQEAEVIAVGPGGNIDGKEVVMQVKEGDKVIYSKYAGTDVELDGTEGILVASKVADRVGITRSVIVNALRKFESAGVIESRSSGMKGTYIKVLNDYVFTELERIKKERM